MQARQRSGVHRDQRVDAIARRVNVAAADVNLEAGHAADAAGRSTYFRGKVGKRAHVIAEDGTGAGELCAGKLHPVAGVTREAYHDAFARFDRLG